MATLASIITEVGTAVETLGTITRASADYSDAWDDFTAGQLKYQIRYQHQQPSREDSNTTIEHAALEVIILHRLADAADEDAWVVAAEIDQRSLLSPSWWRTNVTGILNFTGVELAQDMERIGNVMVYSVLAEFDIVPA